MTSDDAAAPPVLRIVTPNATPEEIAALVTVFSALGGSGEPPRRPVSEWSSHRRTLRTTYPHGPGGWRASGLPR